MATAITPHHSIPQAIVRVETKAMELIQRALTCARQRCSYVGCTRLRHTGPCKKDEAVEGVTHH